MIFKVNEINHINNFLLEEVPKSIGMNYISTNIKEHFNIKPQNGIWSDRKKKEKER